MKNKIQLDAILVVEGKTDVSFLETFVEPIDFVITNGSEISNSTINLIKEYSIKYKIVILTDPDFPGKKIRDTINENVPGCYNAFVSKDKSIKKNKVGVAECDETEISKSLQNLHIFGKNETNTCVTLADLVSWGYMEIDQKNFRKYIANKYRFEESNTKRFLKRINLLNIPIKEEIENYGRK